jgi:hypothetical protein
MSMGLFGFRWLFAIWGLPLFLLSSAVSVLIVGALLVRLPATFFLDSHARDFWIDRHPVVRWSAKILKNLLGVLLVLTGIVLALPGVPGQGLLTILMGLVLIDFPGKRRVERWLISRRGVAEKINRLRAKFGRPPLLLEEKAGGQPEGGAP